MRAVAVPASHLGTHRFQRAVSAGGALEPAETAKRLAKDLYPTKALYDLWEASLTERVLIKEGTTKAEALALLAKMMAWIEKDGIPN